MGSTDPQGHEKIAAHLSNTLKEGQITDVRLDDTPALDPRFSKVPLSANTSSVEFGFHFSLAHGIGDGHVRLVPYRDGTFRAFTVLMALRDLRGHEALYRLPLRDDVTGLAGRDMQREFSDWVHGVETSPYVLIVGGGQCGLQAAVQFHQRKIPSLVIEKEARIGNNWRKRYPSLTLHTIRRHHTLSYQPFPSTWPDFTPRDKLADWIEQYATTQDLVVWTNSELQAHPRYDDHTSQWDAVVIRDGLEVRLRPAHIVIATGLSGRPVIPAFTGLRDRFRGQYIHSSTFPGGTPFTGKRAVVVGAGSSSIDICQELVLKDAESVTMIQRSTTCVISRDFFTAFIQEMFPESEPLEISDLRTVALPLPLQKKLMVANHQAIIAAHELTYTHLRKGGFSLAMAHEGGGPYTMYFDNGGGYWLDKGGAELIGNGQIKVKSGQSINRFTEAGLVLSDGTELPADIVILATGYSSIPSESNAELLGPDVVKRLGPVGGGGGGRDEEGELNGLFRSCGHPGLWFAGGDFFYSRSFAKQLALQIKAAELGLLSKDYETRRSDE